MRDYSEYREAARQGIEAADCTPVLIEDFPSLSTSPRNACLDAVQSSDVYLGVLGHRTGSETPSGRTVVEEEFHEARSRSLPILIFVQEGDREPRQQEFVHEVSEFVGGQYRSSFSEPEELEDEVERALAVLDPSVNEDSEAAASWVSEEIERTLLQPGQRPTLRVAIAPVRQEELVDPRDLQEMGRRILEIGHSGGVELLSYEIGYEPDLQDISIRITPTSGRSGSGSHSRGAIEFYENGRLFVEANVTDLRDRGSRPGILHIIEEDVATQLHRIFALARALYDELDKYKRHQGFIYQTGLFNLGYHPLVPEDEAQESETTMSMGRDDEITAYPEPRPLNRRGLAEPNDEVDRAMERFRRQLSR